MAVTLEHAQLPVSADGRGLDHVETALPEATDALVTQIMEPEIGNASAFT